MILISISFSFRFTPDRLQNLPLVGTSAPCKTNSNRFVRKNAGEDGSGCSSGNTDFSSIVSAIETSLASLDSQERNDVRVLDIEDVSMNCEDSLDETLGASFTATIPGTNNLR
jgi:hypothetical protein